MRRSLHVLAPVMLIGAVQAQAWDYPQTRLADALSKGRLAFRGRVEALRQVDRRDALTMVRADVRILECLYGACSAGTVAEVDYLAQSILEEVDDCFGYPTSIPVAAEVLFVFYKADGATGPLAFNACLRDSPGMAYVLNDEPDGLVLEWSYQTVYGHVDDPPMTLEQVRQAARDRQVVLRGQ